MTPTLLLIGGNGKWGRIFARNLTEMQIPFQMADRATWKQLVASEKFNGAIIATPASTHIEAAEFCLSHSLPVLIEKPVSLTLNELFPLYVYQDLPILINHTQIFTSELDEVKKQLHGKYITEINSMGFGFGPFRNDCSPMLDWCHDFAISLYLSKQVPKILNVEELPTTIGKIYSIHLQYPNFKHHLIIGNGAEEKSRFLEIKCDDGTIFQLDPCNFEQSFRINGKPFYEVDPSSPLENLIRTFIRGIALGVYDDRWGLDLGKKVVKLANDCESFLIK